MRGGVLVLGLAVLLAIGRPGLAQEERSEDASRFGIDYVFPFDPSDRRSLWPETLARTGVRWVNFALVAWASVEPRPPVGGRHRYRWDALDQAVRLWQEHGFRIVLSLRMKKGWFSGPVRYGTDLGLPAVVLAHSDRLPPDEHRASYREWIGALVERYDLDGTDDMPGLASPIRHLQVGNEYVNPVFWSGTVDDYATLLGETAAAARAASPEVVIVSNGIRWNDLFHDDPRAERFEDRFEAFVARLSSDGLRDGWRRARRLTERTVALADVYDILDAGGNGPYPTMSAGYMAWVRRELARHGRTTVVWDMEARSEPMLVAPADYTFHPELATPGGKRILADLQGRARPGHAAAVAWYRAEQSRILVQVFVTRFASGFERVFMGMPRDWDGSPAALSTANPFLGLLDSKGAPWPAFHALTQLVELVDGFARAERLPSEDRVELYRFTFDDGRRPVWVAWLAEDRVRGQGDRLPSRVVRLEAIPRPASVWTTPTSDRVPPAHDLGDELTIGPTPLLIRED